MPEEFDLLIQNVLIVDGTGTPGTRGDIGVKGERIAAVGDVSGSAKRVIDGAGLVACPGFIDMHSHADLNILQYPGADNCIMQGITTFVGGNCGMSPAPLKGFMPWGMERDWWHEVNPRSYGPPSFLSLEEYRSTAEEKLGVSIDWTTFGDFLDRVETRGMSLNFVPLVGHNTIRLTVMGEDCRRTARPDEIAEMAKHVEEGMQAGAFGFSTGLDYLPGEYASPDEVLELTRVAKAHDGLYFTHTRFTNNVYPTDDPGEDPGLAIYHGPAELMAVGRYQGILEAIETGRQLDIPVQIAHISNAFIMNQPHSDEMEEAMVQATLDILDQATAEGLDVTFDIIPNVTGPFNQPGLLFAFTKWVMLSGSKEQFVENLKMKEFRAELRSAITSGRFTLMMLNPATDPYWGNRTTILRCKNKDYEGKTANQIAQSNGTDAIEALFDVLVEDPDTQYQNMVDVRTTAAGIPVFLKHPGAMIGLDHAATGPDTQLDHPYPDFDLQHPNNYGGYPHFITTYVREKGTLSLEDAISKTSYLPAKKLGIQDRGVIRAGAYADIVVFDLENLENRSTFLDPHHAPAGIEHVLVNGEVVYEALAATGRMPGKVLRHRG